MGTLVVILCRTRYRQYLKSAKLEDLQPVLNRFLVNNIMRLDYAVLHLGKEAKSDNYGWIRGLVIFDQSPGPLGIVVWI